MRTLRSLSCALLVGGLVASACKTKKEPGESCRSDTNASLCIDASHAGSCRTFTWHIDPCRGPNGCSAAGVCDQSIAAADDACPVDGARACSANGAEVLRCEGGTMVTEQVCRGERGCFHPTPNAPPSCDPGTPEIGDACVRSEGGRCSADGKALLTCSPETHHMILGRRCLGPKGCFKNAHFNEGGHKFISCDSTVGDVGEPCGGYVGVGTRTGSGGSYCSSDRREVLTCKDGVLVRQLTCACVVKWAADLSSYSVDCDGPITSEAKP